LKYLLGTLHSPLGKAYLASLLGPRSSSDLDPKFTLKPQLKSQYPFPHPKMRVQLLPLTAVLLSCASAATIDIDVGEHSLSFSPNSTTAAKGDTVVFHFYPGKHSVAESSFDSPCAPLANGFYSGYLDSNSGESETTFVVTVNDTNPIWFYCSQGNHCQNGMVGVINPPYVLYRRLRNVQHNVH